MDASGGEQMLYPQLHLETRTRTHRRINKRARNKKERKMAHWPYLAVAYVQSHDNSGRIAIDEMSLD